MILPTWRQCGLLFSGRVSKNLGHTATRTTVGIENATALQQRKKNCELRTAMRRLQDHTMEQWSIRSIRIKRLLELRCVKGFHSTRFLMFRKFYVTANLGLFDDSQCNLWLLSRLSRLLVVLLPLHSIPEAYHKDAPLDTGSVIDHDMAMDQYLWKYHF
jgi:hypothetical protein